jgi:hypothetical protein
MKTFRHFVVSLMLALLLCAPVTAGEMDFPHAPPKPGAVETWETNPDEPPASEPPVETTLTEYVTEIGLNIWQLTLSVF